MTKIPEPTDAANDQIYTLVAAKVVKEQRCSTSWIQREFSIGYNRAARIVERLEKMGIVSPADANGKREVISTANLRTAVSLAEATQPLRDMGATASISDEGIPTITVRIPADTAVRAEVEKSARKGRAPMKKDPDFVAHNNQAYNVTADELRQFIERAEQVNAEIADMRGDLKEIFAEAKGRGYDTKAIRKLIALRKRTPEDIAEEDAIMDLYKAALGMQ